MDDRIRIELEFPLNTSPKLLYPRLSTASGLEEWFADKVNVKGDLYIFEWDDDIQQARLMSKKRDTMVKFQWDEEEDPERYLEFQISFDDLTGSTSLLITDFAEQDDEATTIDLWNKQIAQLRRALGA